MPQTVGIRELKNQASRVLRRVSEEMVEYLVTRRGKPVALLRPLTREEAQRAHHTEVDESLSEMKALAQHVADAWISDKSGVQLVAGQRR